MVGVVGVDWEVGRLIGSVSIGGDSVSEAVGK